MKLSPLNLCHYVVPDISCSANAKFAPDKAIDLIMERFSVESSIVRTEVNIAERCGWTIDLRVSYRYEDEENYPYAYTVQIVGFFSSPSEVPNELDDEMFVRVNGTSILYGIAREKIRTLTAAGPWEVVMIPTVSFYEPKAPGLDKHDES